MADYIKITCSCGKALKAPVEFIGRKAKCPHCGTYYTIPSAETDYSTPLTVEDLVSSDKPETAQKSNAPKTSNGANIGCGIGCGTVVLIVIAFIVYVVISGNIRRSQQAKIPPGFGSYCRKMMPGIFVENGGMVLEIEERDLSVNLVLNINYLPPSAIGPTEDVANGTAKHIVLFCKKNDVDILGDDGIVIVRIKNQYGRTLAKGVLSKFLGWEFEILENDEP